MRPAVVLLVLVGLFAISALAADAPSATDRIPIPHGQRFRDAPAQDRDFSYHDLREVFVAAEKGSLHVWAVLQRPLLDSIFTGVTVLIDCDGKASTGLGGYELMTRACVGSRTRRSSAGPRGPRLPPAIGLRRSGHAVLYDGNKVRGRSWLWQAPERVTKPLVRDRFLYFTIPLELLKENGLRYNDTIRFSLTLDAVIAEDPVWLEVLLDDEGLPIEIDGSAEDWSGGAKARDAVGELHPIARHLDIRDLQVDHGPDELFVKIGLAEAGFEKVLGWPPKMPPGAPAEPASDVRERDRLYVAVEPLGSGGYMDPKEISIRRTSPELRGPDYRHAVREGVAEIAVERPAAQTRFRVMVWSEADRRDGLDGGDHRLKIPAKAWTTKR